MFSLEHGASASEDVTCHSQQEACSGSYTERHLKKIVQKVQKFTPNRRLEINMKKSKLKNRKKKV